MTPNRKILILDIETRPARAYVWRAYGEQNIGVEQIIDAGGVICVGAKWLGHKESYMFADWHVGGHYTMLHSVHKMMSQADAVVTFNGDRFDLPVAGSRLAAERCLPRSTAGNRPLCRQRATSGRRAPRRRDRIPPGGLAALYQCGKRP